jgi:hypothetical protein
MRGSNPLAGSPGIRTDLFLEETEMMTVMEDTGLNAVPFFAVSGAGFATDMIIDTGGGHEIAFVSGVDKHAADVFFPAMHGDGTNATGFLDNAFGAIEPLIAIDGNLMFGDQLFEDLFGDVGFENPHGALGAIDGGSPLAFVAVFFWFLPAPGFGLLIMRPDAMVKFAGETADDGLIASIGKAEATTGKAAKMFVGGEDDHGFAHFSRLDCGDDTG